MSAAVEQVIESRARDLGGFSVARVLPAGRERKLLGPFIFFDHIGPADFAPGEGIDVRPHPHIGLATVTYLFEGELVHRDSVGCVQTIVPGDVNWMTAGRGIVHSERTGEEERARESRLHGIQSWVALPRDAEEAEPEFHHHAAATLPAIERDGVAMRLIAGSAFGETSPVRVHSPLFYLDARMDAGATVDVPDDHPERAVYVATGSLGVAGALYEAGRMLVLAPGAAVTLAAGEPARVMLLGGERMDGDRHIWWNLVSSAEARIERAKADWKAGRFDPVPGETEFIPLPED